MSDRFSPEVMDAINVSFPERARPEVIQALEGLGESAGAGEAVHLAILTAARDDIDEVRFLVREARIDWRDVLLAAQHPSPERYVHWETPAIDVTPRPDGWLCCPSCGHHFTVLDPNSWNGTRHRSCGQKLQVSR